MEAAGARRLVEVLAGLGEVGVKRKWFLLGVALPRRSVLCCLVRFRRFLVGLAGAVVEVPSVLEERGGPSSGDWVVVAVIVINFLNA